MLLIAAPLYLFAPLSAFGSAFLFQRLAVLVAVGALVVLDIPVRREALHLALVVLILCWFALLTVRFRAFDREAREFDAIVELVPANRRLLLFSMNPFSSAVRGPLFLHFAAYYQVRKGGIACMVVRELLPSGRAVPEGAEPRVASPSIPQGRPVDWAGVSGYDFVAFRAATRTPDTMMRGAPFRSRLVFQRDGWWLFETERGSRSTSPPCEPLE